MLDRSKAEDSARWFARCGDRFMEAYRSTTSIKRLENDRTYGLKVFLFDFAFERSGAPRVFRVAAVKAISSLNGSDQILPNLFRQFCTGKCNKMRNPVFASEISELDVPGIVTLVEKGALNDAFEKLDFRGIGHKIRALFLRDLLLLSDSEEKITGEGYRYCQPMDVWVRFTVEALCGTRKSGPARNNTSVRGTWVQSTI